MWGMFSRATMDAEKARIKTETKIVLDHYHEQLSAYFDVKNWLTEIEKGKQMTREEAIFKIQGLGVNVSNKAECAGLVNALEALGLLKFDKPAKAPTFEEAVQSVLKENENSPYEFQRTRGYAEAYVRASILLDGIDAKRAQESELDSTIKQAKAYVENYKAVPISVGTTNTLIDIIKKLLAALQQNTKVGT